jgi:hypothetical protein
VTHVKRYPEDERSEVISRAVAGSWCGGAGGPEKVSVNGSPRKMGFEGSVLRDEFRVFFFDPNL